MTTIKNINRRVAQELRFVGFAFGILKDSSFCFESNPSIGDTLLRAKQELRSLFIAVALGDTRKA